jgi:hypothetical protein
MQNHAAKTFGPVLLALATTILGAGAATTAHADNYAYMGTGSAQFGVIDLTTGVFTQCGTSSVLLSGIGVGPDHNLYGGTFRGTGFYSINRTNGALTAIGASNIEFFDFGSTTIGLYAVDVNGDLYSIDYQTGHATLIGPTHVPVACCGYWGMSTNSGSLYFSRESTLYRLNLKTGAAKQIGPASSGIYGAEVMEHGVLFAGSESPSSIYTLDVKTGASTFVSNLSGAGSFWGLAPIAATSIGKTKICARHGT